MDAGSKHMRLALSLAARGRGWTSPNPMVGAVLVRGGKVIGRGWHQRAGGPHAEIAALLDAKRRGNSVRGATLYVTLEPCSTQGRTPPCTDAIVAAGIRKVVAGATDPNPRHAGRGFSVLKKAGVAVVRGLLEAECRELNPAFNHWIVHRTPWVTVKAAMTLDGKIATASGESKWITGEVARRQAMKLRHEADAILVGIGTVLADDPSLTVRGTPTYNGEPKRLRRIILDSQARTPLTAHVVTDQFAHLTTVVVSAAAPIRRVVALSRLVKVLVAPVSRKTSSKAGLDLPWLLKRLGAEDVTSLLVEGGGEVNASFLLQGLAHRAAFFYAPMIMGGSDAVRAVGGTGAESLDQVLNLSSLHWRRLGPDWLLTATLSPGAGRSG